MTACSPSIVSTGCFAPVPPLVRLSASVPASRPVALAAAFASLSSSRAFLYLPKYLRGAHGCGKTRHRGGATGRGTGAAAERGTQGARGLVKRQGRRAARGTQQLPWPPGGGGQGAGAARAVRPAHRSQGAPSAQGPSVFKPTGRACACRRHPPNPRSTWPRCR